MMDEEREKRRERARKSYAARMKRIKEARVRNRKHRTTKPPEHKEK